MKTLQCLFIVCMPACKGRYNVLRWWGGEQSNKYVSFSQPLRDKIVYNNFMETCCFLCPFYYFMKIQLCYFTQNIHIYILIHKEDQNIMQEANTIKHFKTNCKIMLVIFLWYIQCYYSLQCLLFLLTLKSVDLCYTISPHHAFWCFHTISSLTKLRKHRSASPELIL